MLSTVSSSGTVLVVSFGINAVLGAMKSSGTFYIRQYPSYFIAQSPYFKNKFLSMFAAFIHQECV